MDKLMQKATAILFFLVAINAGALAIYHSYHWGTLIVFGLIAVFGFVAGWVINEEANEL